LIKLNTDKDEKVFKEEELQQQEEVLEEQDTK
jgi:hypothetical protein